MRSLHLTTGEIVLVDPEDFQRVWAIGHWYAARKGNEVYVQSTRFRGLSLVRFVLAYDGPLRVHCIDGNNLNCAKTNLFISNGLAWVSKYGKWKATDRQSGLSAFFTDKREAIEALKAWQEEAKRHRGTRCDEHTIPRKPP